VTALTSNTRRQTISHLIKCGEDKENIVIKHESENTKHTMYGVIFPREKEWVVEDPLL
jgi:hypothetical protein